jgi:hypothetical protein
MGRKRRPQGHPAKIAAARAQADEQLRVFIERNLKLWSSPDMSPGELEECKAMFRRLPAGRLRHLLETARAEGPLTLEDRRWARRNGLPQPEEM